MAAFSPQPKMITKRYTMDIKVSGGVEVSKPQTEDERRFIEDRDKQWERFGYCVHSQPIWRS